LALISLEKKKNDVVARFGALGSFFGFFLGEAEADPLGVVLHFFLVTLLAFRGHFLVFHLFIGVQGFPLRTEQLALLQ
jgi:hypothetical protein